MALALGDPGLVPIEGGYAYVLNQTPTGAHSDALISRLSGQGFDFRSGSDQIVVGDLTPGNRAEVEAHIRDALNAANQAQSDVELAAKGGAGWTDRKGDRAAVNASFDMLPKDLPQQS